MTSTTASNHGRLGGGWLAGALLAGGLLAGCGHSAGPAPQDETWTYICRETGAMVPGPRQTWPAVNPATGRATLDLALYCPECRRWQPQPPPDQRGGNPLNVRCRQHNVPLTWTAP